jgi:hypothetical protein
MFLAELTKNRETIKLIGEAARDFVHHERQWEMVASRIAKTWEGFRDGRH